MSRTPDAKDKKPRKKRRIFSNGIVKKSNTRSNNERAYLEARGFSMDNPKVAARVNKYK